MTAHPAPGHASEEGAEAVLDGLAGAGGDQVRLVAAAAAGEDQVVALSHELGRESGAEQRAAQLGLDREVKLLDGLERVEAGLAHAALVGHRRHQCVPRVLQPRG